MVKKFIKYKDYVSCALKLEGCKSSIIDANYDKFMSLQHQHLWSEKLSKTQMNDLTPYHTDKECWISGNSLISVQWFLCIVNRNAFKK